MAPINNFSPASKRLPGGCWPTPAQTLLLRAALLPPSAAVPAWEEWTRVQNFEDIDSGSFRLLGLAYRNLKSSAGDSPLMPRLHGVYRRFWTTNQLLLGRNTGLIRSFASAGIPIMLTKGAALTASVYHDFGLRPMDDLDLMVPRSHALGAMEFLEKQGWKPEVLYAKELPQSLHACHFRHEHCGVIDLHWQSFHLPSSDAFEAQVWDGGMTFPVNGASAIVPSFSDQFLRACEHGVRYNIVPPFRWLADCYYIWRASGSALDWQRIAEGARLTKSVIAVRDTMRFLRDQLEVPLPADAFSWIEGTPVSWHEQIESRLVRRPCRNLWDKLPIDVSWYLRSTAGQNFAHRLSGFPDHFRRSNNLAHGQLTAHYSSRVRYWFRHWFPYHLRRLPRLFQSKKTGLVSGFRDEDLQGFHDLEPHGHRTFRWSQPQAVVRLKCPRVSEYDIVIDTGNLRAFSSDFSQQIQFTCDGESVLQSMTEIKGGIITIRIRDRQHQETLNTAMKLSWNCVPLRFEGDTREIGLPIFSAKVRKKRREIDMGVPGNR